MDRTKRITAFCIYELYRFIEKFKQGVQIASILLAHSTQLKELVCCSSMPKIEIEITRVN